MRSPMCSPCKCSPSNLSHIWQTFQATQLSNLQTSGSKVFFYDSSLSPNISSFARAKVKRHQMSFSVLFTCCLYTSPLTFVNTYNITSSHNNNMCCWAKQTLYMPKIWISFKSHKKLFYFQVQFLLRYPVQFPQKKKSSV